VSATFRVIADELVAALDGASFSLAISPGLSRLAERNLPTMSSLAVTVVRQSLELQAGDRGGDLADYRLNVVIEKRIDRRQTEAVAIDPLEDLAEEILDFVSGTALATGGAPVSCEMDPVYDPEQLWEKHVFVSVISPTYRLLRDQP